jgi:cytochrome P450
LSFCSFADRLIDARMKEKDASQRADLLSLFMNEKNEQGLFCSSSTLALLILFFCSLVAGPLFDRKQLRDVILNFLFAGRDTTAQALSWTLFNISTSRAGSVDERVAAEINRVFAEGKTTSEVQELLVDPKV